MSTPSLLDRAITDADFARIVDELTRRGFLTGAVGTAAMLGLAACGSSGSDAVDGPGTRDIPTIHGPVRVPAHPTRVVTVSFVGTANLLDVGVVPIGGVTAGVEFLPQYAAALKSMPLVANEAGDVQLETVASLKPDLIVGSDWADAGKSLLPYAKLSAIAPTALFAQAASVGNWADQATEYADAVNRTSRLGPLRNAFTEKQRVIRRSYPELLASQRWELINAASGGWYRYSAQASHSQVLAAAGITFAPGAVGQKEAFAKLSYEQLGRLEDATVIGMGRAVDPAWAKTLTDQPLFTRLPAVQSGHLYDLQWFFPSSYGTATALLEQAEGILRRLQGTR
ncbi:MAG TPA: ABC transporter substrate-binding protein [Mycobacteriales bacterium]|nr:ABC transporter substrate-binding protein [Mycobacteriales bacterium]